MHWDLLPEMNLVNCLIFISFFVVVLDLIIIYAVFIDIYFDHFEVYI